MMLLVVIPMIYVLPSSQHPRTDVIYAHAQTYSSSLQSSFLRKNPLTMKNGTLLRPIVLLSILSASAAGWGKWGIATSCSIQQKELVWNEMNIVRASVKSMADGLTAQPAPSTVTQLYVQWMFGLAQPDYDPIIFPKAVFGGSASIFGLNNFGAQPQTIENMGVGDVVSAPFHFNPWHRLSQ